VDTTESEGLASDRRRALWHAAAALAGLIAGVVAGRLPGSDTGKRPSATSGDILSQRELEAGSRGFL
jgi:hypothetical protein